MIPFPMDVVSKLAILGVFGVGLLVLGSLWALAVMVMNRTALDMLPRNLDCPYCRNNLSHPADLQGRQDGGG